MPTTVDNDHELPEECLSCVEGNQKTLVRLRVEKLASGSFELSETKNVLRPVTDRRFVGPWVSVSDEECTGTISEVKSSLELRVQKLSEQGFVKCDCAEIVKMASV